MAQKEWHPLGAYCNGVWHSPAADVRGVREWGDFSAGTPLVDIRTRPDLHPNGYPGGIEVAADVEPTRRVAETAKYAGAALAEAGVLESVPVTA